MDPFSPRLLRGRLLAYSTALIGLLLFAPLHTFSSDPANSDLELHTLSNEVLLEQSQKLYDEASLRLRAQVRALSRSQEKLSQKPKGTPVHRRPS